MTITRPEPQSEDADTRPGASGPAPQDRADPAQAAEPQSTAAHAARAVMHPDWHDTDWRYYFGAWGG
jgi:hypothetical protein